jgi:hypothetical protein
MKRFLVLGPLALTLALLSGQTASAWVNFKFGAGVNWSWQSGGNNFLWGFFRNGQPPGPDVAYPPNGHAPGYPPGYGGYPGYPPQATFPGNPTPYGPFDFQYFGHQPGMGHDAAQQPQSAPANPQTPVAGQNTQVSWYGNGAYQPVSYSHTSFYSNPWQYPVSSSNGTYNQAPSYWYGR